MNQDQADAIKLEDDILTLLKDFEKTHPHLLVREVCLERTPFVEQNYLLDVETEIILK